MKILSLATLVCAVITIFFEYEDRRFLWFFKPLTVILIIAIAWFFSERPRAYRWAVLLGLFFSLVGDVFLINPQSYFIYGLIGFFIAHLWYIFAFIKVSERFNPLSLFALVVGFLIFATIFNGVPDVIRIPVVLYTLAISTMLCTAVNFWLTRRSAKARLAVVGAFLFIISDSIIAVNRFSYEFFLAKIFVLTTYFTAQWLIARSVGESSAEML